MLSIFLLTSLLLTTTASAKMLTLYRGTVPQNPPPTATSAAPTVYPTFANLIVNTWADAGCKGNLTGTNIEVAWGSQNIRQFRSFGLNRDLKADETLKMYNAYQAGDDTNLDMAEQDDAANCMDFKTTILGNQRKKGCQTLGKPQVAGCFILTQDG